MIFLYLYQKKSTKIFFNKLNYRIFAFKKQFTKTKYEKIYNFMFNSILHNYYLFKEISTEKY